jgi:hypothetical protein
MGIFGLVFWLAVAWLAFRAFRRWQRCATAGPRGYGSEIGWSSGEWSQPREENRSYIDALETRVTELEERLDFTERMLASRQESASSH